MNAKDRSPLMVSVWAELGAGRLTEDYISDKQQFVDGYIEGGHIYINPANAVVETCIHEILHRLHGEWSESYVSNRTTYLLRRMTDQEIQQFYNEYQRRVKRRKKRGGASARADVSEVSRGAVGGPSD